MIEKQKQFEYYFLQAINRRLPESKQIENEPSGVIERLIEAYKTPVFGDTPRSYHTFEHVLECIHTLVEHREHLGLSEEPRGQLREVPRVVLRRNLSRLLRKQTGARTSAEGSLHACRGNRTSPPRLPPGAVSGGGGASLEGAALFARGWTAGSCSLSTWVESRGV